MTWAKWKRGAHTQMIHSLTSVEQLVAVICKVSRWRNSKRNNFHWNVFDLFVTRLCTLANRWNELIRISNRQAFSAKWFDDKVKRKNNVSFRQRLPQFSESFSIREQCEPAKCSYDCALLFGMGFCATAIFRVARCQRVMPSFTLWRGRKNFQRDDNAQIKYIVISRIISDMDTTDATAYLPRSSRVICNRR